MRTLKVNEAVHCRTIEQFITVNNILSKQFGKKLGIEEYDHGKEDTVLSNDHKFGYGYDGTAWHKDHGFKIYSFEDFVDGDKWKPVIGEKYWILLVWDITCINKRIWDNNKTDNSFYKIGNCFKTRKLARIAKANLLKCINEQEHE